MNMQLDPREASPRAGEGGLPLTPPSRGRPTAPHLSIWLPIAVKAAAAAGVALILAVIGAKAGAHGPSPAFAPGPSATPPVVAGAFMVGFPAEATGDAGKTRSTGNPGNAGSPEPAPTASPPSAEVASPGEAVLPDGRVVLNLASEAELTKLPGIGPSRARAILALRQRLTKFRAVEDLLRIKGIGRKMLRRLRPSVVLDRPAVEPGTGPALPGPSPSAHHPAVDGSSTIPGAAMSL
jgi:competence protein ComEA